MNKFKGFLLLAFISFATLLTLTGCGKKDALVADDFKSKMESLGYVVQDATDQFSSDSGVEKVYIALNSDASHQIEFYVVETESQAISAYSTNKSNFENLKSSSAVNTEVNLSNYSKYTLSSNDKFMVISRIDNTFIYVNSDDTYKNNIKKALDNLGY